MKKGKEKSIWIEISEITNSTLEEFQHWVIKKHESEDRINGMIYALWVYLVGEKKVDWARWLLAWMRDKDVNLSESIEQDLRCYGENMIKNGDLNVVKWLLTGSELNAREHNVLESLVNEGVLAFFMIHEKFEILEWLIKSEDWKSKRVFEEENKETVRWNFSEILHEFFVRSCGKENKAMKWLIQEWSSSEREAEVSLWRGWIDESNVKSRTEWWNKNGLKSKAKIVLDEVKMEDKEDLEKWIKVCEERRILRNILEKERMIEGEKITCKRI